MRSLTRSRCLLSLLAAVGVCAPACARRAAPPAHRVTLRIGVGTPQGTTETGNAALINLLKADPWLTTRPDGRITERVASGYAWDPGAMTLRLTLQPNIYFHDGTQITADVAAEELRATAANPRTPVSFKSIRSIRAEGADVVVIELNERNAFLVQDLAGTQVFRHTNEEIGTGPFQVVRRQGEDVTLTAFPKYYRGQPSLAGIEVKSYPTQRKAWTALMRGEIDMLYEVSRDAADFVEAETQIHTYKFPRPYYIPLAFNVRRPVFKDPRVRQAVNLALDRATLLKEGLNNRGSIADGPVPPWHWTYAAPPTPFAFDPAAARKLLDAAKYPLKASARAEVPVRFLFECLIFGNDSRFERIAVLAQKQLADVGIDMRIVPLPLNQLVERLGRGDFDAYLFELTGRSLGWAYEFWRSHPNMRADSGYRAADAVLDRMKTALTDDDTRAAVAELARVFHDDPPAAFLAWQEQARAVSTAFDVAAEPGRDILTNLWLWRPSASDRQAAR